MPRRKPTPQPRILDTRTMEVFRETGLADRIVAESQNPSSGRNHLSPASRNAAWAVQRAAAGSRRADGGSPTHATSFPEPPEPILGKPRRRTR
jgi:hypothetical protein